MDEQKRQKIDKYIGELKQERDELKVKLHLAKLEMKDEWGELQDKLAALEQRLKPTKAAVGETAEELWESIKLVGGEIRAGFHRIRKSL